MLVRLVSNSPLQMIHPPRPPKVLGIQTWATTPSQHAVFHKECTILHSHLQSSPGPGDKQRSGFWRFGHGHFCGGGDFFFLEMESRSVAPRQECMALSRLTAISTAQVQVILLPQPPKQLGLQA
ncbi:hypothetical protein AAY473_025986, partial [Plecturocebus cupreus]